MTSTLRSHRTWVHGARLLTFGVWLIGTVTLWAQLAPQNPQPAYEGQNVTAVSLIANPHRDLSPLFKVVTQQANEPYSQRKIDESQQSLQKAGHFPEVRVQVVPDISGLRVSFLLEPSFYLGVVEFPGAVQRFSYTRLLQIANLSDEDPYDPTRIPVAEQALLEFLHTYGYFQAKVTTTPRIDDAHELVNVNFAVELGKAARIGRVTIAGPNQPEAAQLAHAMRSLRARLSGALLKTGTSYTPARMSAATAQMKRVLSERRRQRRQRADPPVATTRTDRVDVSFKVEVGPVVTIQTVGAKLTWMPLRKRQRNKLIPIYSEGSVDRDLVKKSNETLSTTSRRKGLTTSR